MYNNGIGLQAIQKLKQQAAEISREVRYFGFFKQSFSIVKVFLRLIIMITKTDQDFIEIQVVKFSMFPILLPFLMIYIVHRIHEAVVH